MNNSVVQENYSPLHKLLEKTRSFALESGSDSADQFAQKLDRKFKAKLAKACRGMSPIEIMLAYLDWLSHLAISPGRQLQLARLFVRKSVAMGIFTVASLFNSDAPGPASQLERRVSGDAWRRWPFRVLAQFHQVNRDFMNEATRGVAGVRPSHEKLVNFLCGLVLDVVSPANFLPTNPELIGATVKQRGANLGRGLRNFVVDKLKLPLPQADNEPIFRVGEDVATAKGKVVFQNDLIELIQYAPVTAMVGAEPVLICPAWIMKYYILDLAPDKSLVRYLVEQGKTVFMISWKNPTPEDRDTGFEDYLEQGLMAALDGVNAVCPKRKINAVGYCIGGTLLAAGAAAMARDGDDRLNSVSLFAAQTDFSEAGDITSFISPGQLEFLDNLMDADGILPSSKMGAAFSALHASDLIFGGAVDRYLLGKSLTPIELMAWNADGTAMPCAMHSQYLRRLYLNNELARNLFPVRGKPVSLGDISANMFVLGTETDHVAPWHSVYKVVGLTHAELTFVLTSGGHNAGVVSGPEHPRRRYRYSTRLPGEQFVDPDSWLESNEVKPGSWWPSWNAWLDQQMSGSVKAPSMGAARKGYKPLRNAPGEYVFG